MIASECTRTSSYAGYCEWGARESAAAVEYDLIAESFGKSGIILKNDAYFKGGLAQFQTGHLINVFCE